MHSGIARVKIIIDRAETEKFEQSIASFAMEREDQSNFKEFQLDAVVKEVHNSTKNRPLVVLHKKPVRSLLEDASKRELIEDTWITLKLYWLYATVKLKCLLVTNDEMRAHIFSLLGSNFFFRWKLERHQVRYTFMKGNPKLLMPLSYSLVVQGLCAASAEEASDELALQNLPLRDTIRFT